jgi:hypothetical protein
MIYSAGLPVKWVGNEEKFTSQESIKFSSQTAREELLKRKRVNSGLFVREKVR